jgi:hypothetical protein
VSKVFSACMRSMRHSWRVRFLALFLLLSIPAAVLLLNNKSANALPCPCNVFTTPTGHSNFNDGTDLELGFKFSTDVDGYITGVRFYKQGAMSGTHTGNLWNIGGGSPIASATFTETASGWQEVSFSTPVSVTAGTTYVASVTMPDGRYIATNNYFTSEITNFPLRAPSSSSSGGNGVFAGDGGIFPSNTSGSSNYWVDVVYRGNLGATAPVVSATVPTDSATGVNPGEMVSATFDDKMDTTTLTTSTFTVKDSDDNTVPGVVAYNNATKIVTFAADEGFSTSETYTATIEGGTGTVATNMEGVALAADYTWTFTIGATNDCPCSLQDRASPAGTASFDETSGVELGTKITPQANGYITKVRFYKPIMSPDSTHVVHVWSATGTSLATTTTSGESDYGWQEVKLPTPLRVTKGTTYVVSYSTPSGVYVASQNYHNTDKTGGYLTSYATGSAQNAATGSGNNNGVFASTAGNYPNVGSTNGSYYWIDAVFSVTSTPDDPPSPTVTQPSANTFGVDRSKPIKAAFDRPMDSGTVTNSSVRLFDSSNVAVSGTASYDAASHSVVFTPSSPLSYNGKYTVRLSDSIADNNGEELGEEYTWTFTVGSQLLTDVNEGPGGPILVVTASADKYGKYYAEILRTEGLNYFEVKDISAVNTGVLSGYDAVVLAEMPLTQPQADMFSSWVTDGGNLVAMRPDKKLAGLFGLTDAGTTRTNQYFKVNTLVAPGQGIVSDSMQYKGAADNYTAGSATVVADLYSTASLPTVNPAVTTKSVGSKGGMAAAFTFDLAKSVIALHQGNPAWAGQNRDGDGAIRTNDMFFGARSGDVQPDWVDLDKIHIPQADEQQRLLANILTEATEDRRPLPRFWYLPGDYKAAMVMAGDDHALTDNVGTERIFSNWLNESPKDCELAAWECVRASGYVYSGSALTPSRALQFHNWGFGVADHAPDSGGCASFTSYSDLLSRTNAGYTDFYNKYTTLPTQKTGRYHCYVWSDYDSVPRVDETVGVRYDLNYVTFPPSWIGTRPAIITGSGMNMRLTDADGDILNVQQGVTNFENTVTGSAAINTVLANATGSNGFYGIFGTHYDMSDSYHTTLFNAAKANGVPIISSEQALEWLDGRGSSSFKDFSGTAGQYSFAIEAATGSQGLRAMMPIADQGGSLTGITMDGSAVSYQTQAVKGVQYAVFDGQPGAYTATYSDYVPSSGSGGSQGGSSSDSQTTNNSGTAKTSKKKAVALTIPVDEAQDQTPDTVLQPGDTPQEEPTDDKPDESGKDDNSSDAEEKGLPMLWIGIGIALLLIFLGWWAIASRRRHAA